MNHINPEKVLKELQRLKPQGHQGHICAAVLIFVCGFVLGKKCSRRPLLSRRGPDPDQPAAKPEPMQRWESEGGRSLATVNRNVED